MSTLTVPSELTDRGVPPVGASPSRSEVVDDADVGAADAEGAAEPAEEGVAEASEDGAADAEEEVSEEASGAAEDGAVDEAGSPADVLDSAGSFEGDVVGSAAEIVDGLAGLLTPEARSMLTRSPQSRVFAPILQLRLCPASSSGRGTCQTAWEAEELSPRATRVSRRSAITRRIISWLLTRAVAPLASKDAAVGSLPRLDRSCWTLRIGALTRESGSELRVSAHRPPPPSARTRATTTPRVIRRPLRRCTGREARGEGTGSDAAADELGSGDWDEDGESDGDEEDSGDGDMGTA